jgi:phosphatidylserine decarboxylase
MDPFLFLLWRFYYFFRDPERRTPEGRVIVSPADGRILYAREIQSRADLFPVKQNVPVQLNEWDDEDPSFFKGNLIGIYMTPVSVHVNRSPISGKIRRIIDRPAINENLSMARTFIRLVWDMMPFEEKSDYINRNARNILIIDGDISLAVIRIADRYVNQIDCFVSEGDIIEKGSRIGMIRMGSQCDLFIPSKYRITMNCKPRDKVTGGETILAYF